MKIMLVVAYNGANYCGSQIQTNGMTIEQKLTDCLFEIFGEKYKLTGASRTDAGVHALGNVWCFEADIKMPAEKICYAMNQRLPDDIAVQESLEVPEDFHPRYDVVEKTYEYKILNCKHRRPQNSADTFFYHHPLDVDRMKAATAALIGEHDFTSFSSVHRQTKTTIRTIYSCYVFKEGDIITIRICGNGFLYNMVRIIAGTLIEVGGGKKEPADVAKILAGKVRALAGPTAPAEGLTLVEIVY